MITVLAGLKVRNEIKFTSRIIKKPRPKHHYNIKLYQPLFCQVHNKLGKFEKVGIQAWPTSWKLLRSGNALTSQNWFTGFFWFKWKRKSQGCHLPLMQVWQHEWKKPGKSRFWKIITSVWVFHLIAKEVKRLRPLDESEGKWLLAQHSKAKIISFPLVKYWSSGLYWRLQSADELQHEVQSQHLYWKKAVIR